MRRRTFLAAGIAGSTVACNNRNSSWRFFSVEEARTVESICTQIIPEDQDPG